MLVSTNQPAFSAPVRIGKYRSKEDPGTISICRQLGYPPHPLLLLTILKFDGAFPGLLFGFTLPDCLYDALMTATAVALACLLPYDNLTYLL